jgi:hypothetical protein
MAAGDRRTEKKLATRRKTQSRRSASKRTLPDGATTLPAETQHVLADFLAIQIELVQRSSNQGERQTARVKHIQEAIGSWRMARDIRAYVADIHALVKDADLKITEGGGPDEELKWALNYADRIDPLTSRRQDIEKVKAKLASEPCPGCGKVHGADETDADEGDDADGASSESGDASETEPGPGVA